MLFKLRSNEKEFLDNDFIDAQELYLNLKELDVINKQLGGYNVSLKGLSQILKIKSSLKNILDIGFGGGDSIKQLSLFASKSNKTIFFYGVDLKSDCVKYAEQNLSLITNKKLICDNYKNISEALLNQVDVIHCSLFLHHLTNEEIIGLFKFAKSNRCIILANDLHRNWLAYYSIKLITALFSKSRLVKNDAPISVKRGFRKKELESLLIKAGFTKFSVKWCWAFRYLIIAEG